MFFNIYILIYLLIVIIVYMLFTAEPNSEIESCNPLSFSLCDSKIWQVTQNKYVKFISWQIDQNDVTYLFSHLDNYYFFFFLFTENKD